MIQKLLDKGFALSGLVLLAGAVQAQEAQQVPNIVLFIADDVSWNDFRCTGNPLVHTPNIDRIAGEGIIFTNAYLTASSSSPSRCSLISGRYPHNTGAAELHTGLPIEMPLFPELLKENGYYTAQSGKWHMGPHAERAFDLVEMKNCGDGGEEQWLNVVRKRPEDKPFFMWFAAYDAHRGWGPNDFSGTNDPNLVEPPVYLVDTTPTRKDLAQYYDEITRFDHYIGLIEAELDKQGVLNNTIIIIMADNGRPFPRCKTRVYDSGMKTPFIIKWPKGIRRPGAHCHSLLSVIDLAPTLLDVAGCPIGESFQGKSFACLFDEPDQPFRKYVFAEHNWHDYEAHERMLRTKDYLYVVNARPQFPNQGPADSNSGPSYNDLKKRRDQNKLNAAQTDVFLAPRPYEELFDYQKDKQQLLNISALAEYQEVLINMRAVMQQWQAETADDVPDAITPDLFDRETGKFLPEYEKMGTFHEVMANPKVRGQMPGKDSGALKCNNKGPF